VAVIRSGVEPPAGLPGAAGRAAARARFGADGERVIGIVAALERRKGHDVLLRALATLDGAPPWRCLVCGGGSQHDALRRLAADLGIADRVRFIGEQPQVADVLAALDVFVMPSRHEGLGVPVIASAVGGIPEAVKPRETGLLVPPDDPAALAAALNELLRDVEKAKRMGVAGRERVLAEFSMEEMASQYERLYDDVSRRV
jgi:glycosyltransferase involved in cell wall biosynthesis